MKLSRSTYYFRKDFKRNNPEEKVRRCKKPRGFSYLENGIVITDEEIVELIRDILGGECCCYGYKKVSEYLRVKKQILINKKKVYRLMHENGLLKPIKRKSAHRIRVDDRKIERPNQLWATDIKYGYISGEDRNFYILNYIDVFTREIVGYYAGYNCNTKDAARTLDMAIKQRGIDSLGLILRSDNGSQFISGVYEGYCGLKGIYHEFTHVRTPEENGHIESFHRILETEFLERNEFDTLEEAKAMLADWMDFYNKRRMHSALKFKSPSEFYQERKSMSKILLEKVI